MTQSDSGQASSEDHSEWRTWKELILSSVLFPVAFFGTLALCTLLLGPLILLAYAFALASFTALRVSSTSPLLRRLHLSLLSSPRLPGYCRDLVRMALLQHMSYKDASWSDVWRGLRRDMVLSNSEFWRSEDGKTVRFGLLVALLTVEPEWERRRSHLEELSSLSSSRLLLWVTHRSIGRLLSPGGPDDFDEPDPRIPLPSLPAPDHVLSAGDCSVLLATQDRDVRLALLDVLGRTDAQAIRVSD